MVGHGYRYNKQRNMSDINDLKILNNVKHRKYSLYLTGVCVLCSCEDSKALILVDELEFPDVYLFRATWHALGMSVAAGSIEPQVVKIEQSTAQHAVDLQTPGQHGTSWNHNLLLSIVSSVHLFHIG